MRNRVKKAPRRLASLPCIRATVRWQAESRVEGWRAGVARGARLRLEPPPRRRQRADFPHLRAPICFTPKLMGPILLGRLSARRVALDRR